MLSRMSAPAPRPRGDHCPSCERFMGPADRCPFCGEDSAKSPALHRLRQAAFLLALLGLACLYLMVTHRELPVVRVADITPMMNFAYVRVVGQVVREPFVGKRNGRVDYCSFQLDDGSGVLRVQASRETAELLAARVSVMGPGTLVDVAGSLNVAAGDEAKLRLQTTAQLHILSDRTAPLARE